MFLCHSATVWLCQVVEAGRNLTFGVCREPGVTVHVFRKCKRIIETKPGYHVIWGIRQFVFSAARESMSAERGAAPPAEWAKRTPLRTSSRNGSAGRGEPWHHPFLCARAPSTQLLF